MNPAHHSLVTKLKRNILRKKCSIPSTCLDVAKRLLFYFSISIKNNLINFVASFRYSLFAIRHLRIAIRHSFMYYGVEGVSNENDGRYDLTCSIRYLYILILATSRSRLRSRSLGLELWRLIRVAIICRNARNPYTQDRLSFDVRYPPIRSMRGAGKRRRAATRTKSSSISVLLPSSDRVRPPSSILHPPSSNPILHIPHPSSLNSHP